MNERKRNYLGAEKCIIVNANVYTTNGKIHLYYLLIMLV